MIDPVCQCHKYLVAKDCRAQYQKRFGLSCTFQDANILGLAHDCQVVEDFIPDTSTSSSSMTCNTTARDSMKPFTATRSMRLVVALYSVRRTVPLSFSDAGLPSESVKEYIRCTEEEGSWSTLRERRAVEARR